MASQGPIAPQGKSPLQLADTGKPPATERPNSVYALVCFLGSVLITLLGVLGVLLLAYGAGVLVSKKKASLAYLAAAAGSFAEFLYSVPTGASVLFLGMITVLFTMAMPKRFTQGWWITGVLVITAVLFGLDATTAYMAGTTVAAQVSTSVQDSVNAITASGSIPAESLNAFESAVSTIVLLWPSMYFFQGVAYMACITGGAIVAFMRHMPEFKIKRFAELDITIHAIWPFVAGLVFFAASYLASPYATYLKVIGLNLLLCMAAIFCIQGLALIEYWTERQAMHPAVRVVVYILALQLELMFMFLTIIGLLDFWINFRKLPRGVDDEGTGEGRPGPQDGADGQGKGV